MLFINMLLIFKVVCLLAFHFSPVDSRQISSALSASSPPGNDEFVYTCLGRRANFLWTAQLDQGDEIVLVTWTFQSAFSTITIAKFSPDDFLVSSSYAKRVRQVGMTGLVVNSPTLQDSGRYRVEVDGHNSKGIIFSLNASADLLVGESLMVREGGLKVRQLPEAQKDRSGQWSVALACGHFLYPGPLPFNVTWTTPSRQNIPSSHYANHHFVLLLPNPVEGGNYTCSIPAAFHQDACATAQEVRQSQTSATVEIDELRSRFSLLESEVLSLRSSQAEALGSVAGLRNAQDNTSAAVTSAVQSLQVTVANMSALVQNFSTLRVGFNVRMSTPQSFPSSGSKVIFDIILLNDGNAYNSGTGIFTAPVAGLYLFALTTRSHGTAGSADADVTTAKTTASTRETVCRIDSNIGNDAAACSGVANLSKDQLVWVQTHEPSSYFSNGIANCFTGCLIRPDL